MNVRLRPRFAEDPLAVLVAAAASGDGVAPLRIGPARAVVVTDPVVVREVLVERPQDFPKGRRQLAALRPVLGHGLLTSERELHDRQRRVVQPSFVPASVNRYVDTIVAEAVDAVGRWPRGDVDVVPLVNVLAMNIVGRMLFGRSMRDEGVLAEAIQVAFEWEMRALTSLVPAPAWLPTRRNRRLRSALASVDARLGDLTTSARDTLPSGAATLLGRLLDSRDADGLPMVHEQLFDEVRTIWGAAHETSADAQVWTLALLARHPEVADRLVAEVDSVLAGRPPTGEDLARLPYTMQVFKESMRLYPPAAVILRSARRTTTLGGLRLLPGTPVFLCPYVMHRRGDLFTDPERFDPDRFAPRRERELPRFAYLPFGAGRRACVGGYLALLEGQILTAILCQRLRMEPLISALPQEELLINLRPSGEVRLRLQDRSSRTPAARGAGAMATQPTKGG